MQSKELVETKKNIARTKETPADQNSINLTSKELSDLQKSLLQKGSSFVPTPSDVNWYEIKKVFKE